jgi:hypothetical protein
MEKNNWLSNPHLYSHGCTLSAYGINFASESFLSEISFDPELVIFKGQMGYKTFEWVGEVKPRDKEIFEYSHLILKVSKSEAHPTQVDEAALFLKQYQKEIKRLSEFPQVETVSLQFSVAEGELRENLSRDFMDLAFGCGISSVLS